MKKIVSAILLTIMVSICVAQSNQQSDFDVERLSAKGREAYQKLLSAGIFRLGGVGYSGETSKEELALHILLGEENAIAALRNLVRHGTPEGGLYGLSGLHVLDTDVFKSELAFYKSKALPANRVLPPPYGEWFIVPEGHVLIQSGCMVSAEQKRVIVDRIESGNYDSYLKRYASAR